MVTETRTVVEQVEVSKPLPNSLTDPIQYSGLPEHFTIDDVFDALFDAYDKIDTANADRAKSRELTQPQPSEADLPQ